MANSWIKFEKVLIGDPRVRSIAEKLRVTHPALQSVTLDVTVTLVLGGLGRMWCYSDTYIGENDIVETTVDHINEVVGIAGFAQLLPPDWFQVVDPNRVKFPKFHSHNGSQSKKQALTAARVAKHRALKKTQAEADVTSVSRNDVTDALHALPDLDQDQDLEAHALPALRTASLFPVPHHFVEPQLTATSRRSNASRIPDDFGLTDSRRAVALAEHVDAEREVARFRDFWLAKSGADARKHDWDATWRNWCRRAGELPPGRTNGARVEQPVLRWRPPEEDGSAPK